MVDVSVSVLNSTKKALGLDAEYDVFDPEIIMHINSTFATLSQLGVGPATGFAISDENDTWASFFGAPSLLLNNVKTYMYLQVKLIFDPPPNSFSQSAIKDQLTELAWRINVAQESGPAPMQSGFYLETSTMVDGGEVV